MDATSRVTAEVPIAVKQAFRRAVISQSTDMTAVLVAMMADYAVRHGEKVVGDE